MTTVELTTMHRDSLLIRALEILLLTYLRCQSRDDSTVKVYADHVGVRLRTVERFQMEGEGRVASLVQVASVDCKNYVADVVVLMNINREHFAL